VSYTLRRATPEDAALVAGHRARIWHEAGGWDESLLTAQVPIWTAWFREALADGRYISWVAEEHGEPLASGSLLIQRSTPRPGSASDRDGRVQGVYVLQAARRRGIARALMAQIMAFARAEALIRLTLHPTDEARGLYESLGFTVLDELGLQLVEDP
jgi:ribosomal protein S18 acetylase RimI-like enzyme